MASVTPLTRRHGYAWRVQARDDQRKMRQETFYGDDPRTVEAAARPFGQLVDRVGITEAARIRDARDAQSGNQVPTLAEWIDSYLDPEAGLLTGISPGTREAYRRMAAATIKPRLGELPVNEVTDLDVTRWIGWLEAQPSPRDPDQSLAMKTVRNHHGFLSQVLAAADKRGLRTGNPARGARLTRTRRSKMTVLSPSEFTTLVHFVPPAHRPLIMWLAGTGMRWGEATALTWGDIDRDARPALVHITKAWQKPAAGGGRVLGPPKTEAGERTISVPDQLLAELGRPGPGDELVFTTGAGTSLWSSSFWTRVWKPAVDAANDPKACAAMGLVSIGKRPRLHDLRHSHVSWLIAAGRPLPYIQARVGHEKITTTIDVYGHLLPDAQQGDADAILTAMAGMFPQLESADAPPAVPALEG